MTGSNTPRYLPTLTEVVSPEAARQSAHTAQSPMGEAEPSARATASPSDPDDTAAITQHVVDKMTPLLEQQLRSLARELLEAQMNLLLPALQAHMEAAVRQALQETLDKRRAQS